MKNALFIHLENFTISVTFFQFVNMVDDSPILKVNYYVKPFWGKC